MQAKILNGKILAYFLPPMPECTLHIDGLRLAQCLQDLYFANNKHIVEKYENHLMMKGRYISTQQKIPQNKRRIWWEFPVVLQ